MRLRRSSWGSWARESPLPDGSCTGPRSGASAMCRWRSQRINELPPRLRGGCARRAGGGVTLLKTQPGLSRHIDHDQVRSERSDLMNVIGFLKWVRDRTESRNPLFLIALPPRLGPVGERIYPK